MAVQNIKVHSTQMRILAVLNVIFLAKFDTSSTYSASKNIFTLLVNFLIQLKIVWYNHNLFCLLIQMSTWIIDSWLFANNFISPIASKHLLIYITIVSPKHTVKPTFLPKQDF